MCSRRSSTAHLLQSKESIIRQAISEVPKSGEVWCVWVRCSLNTQSVGSAESAAALIPQSSPGRGRTIGPIRRDVRHELTSLLPAVCPGALQLEKQRHRARISAVEGMSFDFGDLSASYHEVRLKHLTRRQTTEEAGHGLTMLQGAPPSLLLLTLLPFLHN